MIDPQAKAAPYIKPLALVALLGLVSALLTALLALHNARGAASQAEPIQTQNN